MTCAICGWPLHDGALFCGNCGHRVETPGPGVPAAPAAPAGTAPARGSADALAPVPDPTDPRLPHTGSLPTTRIDRLPPASQPPASAPAATLGWTPSALDADDEATVLAPRRPAWALVTPAGERIALRQATVVGRTPTASVDAVATALVDPTRSVSKTHARLTPLGDAVRIEDLGSTNGTIVVEADGVETELVEGQHLDVRAAVRLELGEYVLHLDRA